VKFATFNTQGVKCKQRDQDFVKTLDSRTGKGDVKL
jgi:hypothetical protein